MAIIVKPPANDGHSPEKNGSVTSLEAMILPIVRPALLTGDGRFSIDDGSLWSAALTASRSLLERALLGVARFETANPALPYVGTAFVIDSRWAVTANYVAETALQGWAKGSQNSGQEAAGTWLNFKAEYGSDAKDRVGVRKIHLVHPYWGFAFLELEDRVDQARVLPISPKLSDDELEGRDICVIGYPALDVRNEESVMRSIFGDIYNVKRLMPGKITGSGRAGRDDSVVLKHDATTLGGTGGAPLIDMASGSVLGLQVSGQYLLTNNAAPAWELGRDPQWPSGIKNDVTEKATEAAPAPRRAIEISDENFKDTLSFDEVIELYTALSKVGMADKAMISTLFAGLPSEYVGAIDGDGSPTNRLLRMLHGMNAIGGTFGGHSAFYYVIRNAGTMRPWETRWKAFLDRLLEREKTA